jgi:hypothetical protein
VLYKYQQVNLEKWDNYAPRLPAHQGVFHRGILFLEDTPFDDSYKVVADSKLVLTSSTRTKVEYFNIDICKMLPGGVSSRDDKIILVKDEWLRLEKELNYKIPLLRKSKYLFTVYVKFYINKFAGPKMIALVRKIKRKLLMI